MCDVDLADLSNSADNNETNRFLLIVIMCFPNTRWCNLFQKVMEVLSKHLNAFYNKLQEDLEHWEQTMG